MVEAARNRVRHRAFAMVELLAGMMILSVTVAVVTMNAAMERQRLRALYHRAVAEQVLDGYREVLAAGAWRNYPDGEHVLTFDSPAFQALPDGRASLVVTRDSDTVALSLQWSSRQPRGIGELRKEAVLPLRPKHGEVRQP